MASVVIRVHPDFKKEMERRSEKLDLRLPQITKMLADAMNKDLNVFEVRKEKRGRKRVVYDYEQDFINTDFFR